MISKNRFFHYLTLLIFIWIFNLSGCTTTEIAPPLAPLPPDYTYVPHPQGADIGDIEALFTEEAAPKDPTYDKYCDKDFRELKRVARSTYELTEGTRQLVKQDPVNTHWCFYAKLLSLEYSLKSEPFIDVKQKNVIDTFQFLVPIARTFYSDFHDSRYLRFAIVRYRKMSELVFYRRLELTPGGTSELVQAANPFGLWRDSGGDYSILQKYHLDRAVPISLKPSPIPTSPPTPIPSSAPSLMPDDRSSSIPEAPAPLTTSTPTPVTHSVPEGTQPPTVELPEMGLPTLSPLEPPTATQP
jgi:hypothetical protein